MTSRRTWSSFHVIDRKECCLLRSCRLRLHHQPSPGPTPLLLAHIHLPPSLPSQTASRNRICPLASVHPQSHRRSQIFRTPHQAPSPPGLSLFPAVAVATPSYQATPNCPIWKCDLCSGPRIGRS